MSQVFLCGPSLVIPANRGDGFEGVINSWHHHSARIIVDKLTRNFSIFSPISIVKRFREERQICLM